MNRFMNIGTRIGVAAAALVVSAAIATGSGGGNCCYTSTCTGGVGQATDCLGSKCASNQRCSGVQGCTPTPWAKAKCIPIPPVIP